MRRVVWSAILFSALVSSPAFGRDDDMTMSSSVEPVFAHGEIDGCSIVFDVVHRDTEYFKGQLVHLSGSLNYFLTPAPEITLKLGVEPLGRQPMAYKAPAEAYLIRGYETNKVDELKATASELPGYKLFNFRLQGNGIKALSDVGNGTITFGYAMEPGGMLSPVQVNIRMKDLDLERPQQSTLDEGAPQRWLECITKASEAEFKRLKSVVKSDPN